MSPIGSPTFGRHHHNTTQQFIRPRPSGSSSGITISSLSPDNVPQNTIGYITVIGSGYTDQSVITVNGADQQTTEFLDENTLRYIQYAPINGILTIQVRDSGNLSNTISLSVTTPPCQIAACSPSTYPNGPGQLITVSGTMFGAGGADVTALSVTTILPDGTWAGYDCTGFVRVNNTTVTGTTPDNLPTDRYFASVFANSIKTTILSSNRLLTIT